MYVEVKVDKIIHETDEAFLCDISDEETWIPKSQVDEPEAYEEGDEDIDMNVTLWFCEKKGIEFDE